MLKLSSLCHLGVKITPYECDSQLIPIATPKDLMSDELVVLVIQ
jgi:hypothetical protein